MGNPSSKGSILRKGMITVQFIVSSLLIISTLIISKQLNFIQEKNLGFDEELLVSVNLGRPTIRPDAEVIKSNFLSNSSVSSVSKSYGSPGVNFGGLTVDVTLLSDSDQKIETRYVMVDEDFLSTLNIRLIAGIDYVNGNLSMIETGALINESAARALGFGTPAEAIGKHVDTIYDEDKEIIGVIEDFHFESVHTQIEPLILVTTDNYYPYFQTLNIRLKPGNLSESIASLKQEWNKLETGTPLDFVFMDDAIAQLYQRETNIAKLFSFFAAIAIIISCVGLLGLTAYTAQRRTKEIGIRKILGASIQDIVQLLSRDFLVLVLLGFVISIPITWYVMNKWLAEFAYKIELGAGIFVLSGLIAVSIALLTVSFQSIRAATANPVDSLRNE